MKLWLIPNNSNKKLLKENKAENNYTNLLAHQSDAETECERDVVRSIYKVHSSKSLCALKTEVKKRKRNQKLENKVFKLRLQ